MKSIKITSIILALLMLAGTVSCGDAGKQPESNSDTSAADSSSAEETTDQLAPPVLPDEKYDGYEFRILTRVEGYGIYNNEHLVVEGENGEVLNDALYNRCRNVEEKLDVKFSEIVTTGLVETEITKTVMAGDDSYDLTIIYDNPALGTEYLVDFNTLEYVNLDRPWWDQNYSAAFSINGKLCTAVGSIMITHMDSVFAMFYNKKLASDYKLPDLYELVRNGSWTMPKFFELTKDVTADLNGDGKFELGNDRIGYTFDLQAGRALLPSCGMKVATKTADDSYEYAFMTDKFVEMYAKVYRLVNEYDYSVYSNGNIETMQGEDVYSIFKSGYVLFLGSGIRGTDNLRDMTADYGIIPYPMYDENQDSYYTFNYGTPYMSMLLSTKDPEMTAVMLEALNAESYKSVVPAYLDTALKGKYSRDAETAEMLDLVNSTSFFDFTFVNETSTDHIVMWFFDQLASGVENIASAYEGRKSGFENSLQKLLETYKEAADAK